MKKILLALLACLFATAVDAQTTLPWGLATGANPRNVQMRDTAGTWDTIGTLNSTTHAFALALGVLPTIPLTQLATQAANTAVANFTGSTAAPVAFTMPACSNATPAFLDYTNGTGIVCSGIANNTLTFAMEAQIAANTIVGNFTGSTANRAAQTINGGSSCSTALTYTNGTGIGCAAGAVSSITPISPLNATQSPITSSASLYSINVASPSGYRLTLTTGTPVMTANVSAATSILLSPYNSSAIVLWNTTTSSFVETTCAEMSNVLANSSTGNAGPAAVVASGVYDLFAWNSGTLSSPTCTLSRGPAWTNSTTRSAGTAIARTGGLLLNSIAITNGPGANQGLYVGTFVADSGGGTVSWNTGGSASGGTAATLDVWNMYNRVSVLAQSRDTGTAYTYTTATTREARGGTGMQATLMQGLAEDAIFANFSEQIITVAVTNADMVVGVSSLNSTTTQDSEALCQTKTAATAVQCNSYAHSAFAPALGVQVIAGLETGDGSNANTVTASSVPTASTLNVMSRQ